MAISSETNRLPTGKTWRGYRHETPTSTLHAYTRRRAGAPGDEQQGDRTSASYGTSYEDDLLKEIIWRLDGNAHDTAVMSSNFYKFAQRLFKE